MAVNFNPSYLAEVTKNGAPPGTFESLSGQYGGKVEFSTRMSESLRTGIDPIMNPPAMDLDSLKASERTATIPGAETGGSNLSSSIAAVQPRTAAEEQLYENMIAANADPITAENFVDSARAGREQASDTIGFKPPFNLGDVQKKFTEGAEALTSKFNSFDITKKFDGLAKSAKTFLFGQSPEGIAKQGEALASKTKNGLINKATGTPSAADANAAMGPQNVSDKSHLVTLTDAEGYVLEFVVMPEIQEQRQVEYEPVAPPQFPGAFQKYKGTSSVQWTVNATFICRTTDEATQNLAYLNRLRGWTMPFFGIKTQDDSRFKDRIGAPPPVLKFKGFRESIVGEVPVVITSLSWNWPRDVDFIPARRLADNPDGSGPLMDGEPDIPFPTVMQVAISLVESFSTNQFNNLNIGEYRVGHMLEAFSGVQKAKNNTTGQPEQREEAQVSPAGAFRGIRSDALTSDINRIYPIQTTLSASVGAGRGLVVPEVISEAAKSTRPFLGRVGQMFKKDKGWEGGGPGSKNTTTGM